MNEENRVSEVLAKAISEAPSPTSFLGESAQDNLTAYDLPLELPMLLEVAFDCYYRAENEVYGLDNSGAASDDQ